VIDRPLHDLPWPAIHADLVTLAKQEARRVRVPYGAAEDAAQEAGARILAIGVRGLPPELVGPKRGAWLRLLVRHVLFAMARAEDRWQRANGPARVQSGPTPPVPQLFPGSDEPVDFSVLPPNEWRVITLLRLYLTASEIAELEGIDVAEVTRRARWGAFRLRLPNARCTWRFGQEPGSLRPFRGSVRRALARILRRNGWDLKELATEFGTTSEAIRVMLARGLRE
jgi:hypothetical protein